MVKQNVLLSYFSIFFLSLAAAFLWLFEIYFLVGWHGLTWLSAHLYSIYPAISISAIIFLIPFLMKRQVSKKNILISATVFFIVNFLCFQIGKNICYSLYSKYYFVSGTDFSIMMAVVAGLYFFIGFFYTFITHRFIKKNRKANILLLFVLLPLAIPLSLLTIYINPGFGTGTDWVDAVKMGYPIFWTILLLGVSGILIERQSNKAY